MEGRAGFSYSNLNFACDEDRGFGVGRWDVEGNSADRELDEAARAC